MRDYQWLHLGRRLIAVSTISGLFRTEFVKGPASLDHDGVFCRYAQYAQGSIIEPGPKHGRVSFNMSEYKISIKNNHEDYSDYSHSPTSILGMSTVKDVTNHLEFLLLFEAHSRNV
jgi:hypothetical protein